jgi:hypothetical protein
MINNAPGLDSRSCQQIVDWSEASSRFTNAQGGLPDARCCRALRPRRCDSESCVWPLTLKVRFPILAQTCGRAVLAGSANGYLSPI